MIIFTIVDYWQYNLYHPLENTVEDITQKYKLLDNTQNKLTHQYHDKIFREILNNKQELESFMKKYLKCQNIKAQDIEKYDTKFVTKELKIKESDIIYKVKEKNVFILIEHQSTVDYYMPIRITEYCIELIRNVIKEKSKNTIYPLIYPIVLYTGNKKWDAPLTIGENQEEYYEFMKLNYPKYNLVDINNYTKIELINDKSVISKAMLFEKLQTKKELQDTMKQLMSKELTTEEINYLKRMLRYSNIINKKYPEQAKQWYKEIEKKEGVGNMTQFEKLFIQLYDERYQEAEEKGTKAGMQKGMQKGMEKGIKKGKKEEKIEIVKRMLKMQMKDKEILHIAKIKTDELEKIKAMV